MNSNLSELDLAASQTEDSTAVGEYLVAYNASPSKIRAPSRKENLNIVKIGVDKILKVYWLHLEILWANIEGWITKNFGQYSFVIDGQIRGIEGNFDCSLAKIFYFENVAWIMSVYCTFVQY